MASSLRPPLRPGPMDVHAHVVPEGLMDRLGPGERTGFAAETSANGERRITLGPGARPSAVAGKCRISRPMRPRRFFAATPTAFSACYSPPGTQA